MPAPSSPPDWRNISYLASGTPRQQRAHRTLHSLDLLPTLQPFDPTLVSTICVDVGTEASDLDVICEVSDPEPFVALVRDAYGHRSGFTVYERDTDPPSWVARFDTPDFPIEIFGQARPVEHQLAWRHLSVMHRLLTLAPALREPVRERKRRGLATEAAFADLLGLDGDPYDALLQLENGSDLQLARLCGAEQRPGPSSPTPD